MPDYHGQIDHLFPIENKNLPDHMHHVEQGCIFRLLNSNDLPVSNCFQFGFEV